MQVRQHTVLQEPHQPSLAFVYERRCGGSIQPLPTSSPLTTLADGSSLNTLRKSPVERQQSGHDVELNPRQFSLLPHHLVLGGGGSIHLPGWELPPPPDAWACPHAVRSNP